MPEVRRLGARLFALDLRRRRDLAHSATTLVSGIKRRKLVRRLAPATHAQLLQYRGDVVVDRPGRNHQALRDLGVRDAGTQHPEDLDLTVCETSGIGPASERPPTWNLGNAERPQPAAHESSGRLRTQIEKQLQRFESGYLFA